MNKNSHGSNGIPKEISSGDPSHRKDFGESEARLRAVFDASPDAIVITDDNGIYIEANPAVEQIFGISRDQLVGCSIRNFLGKNKSFESIWENFLTEGRFRGETVLRRNDGSFIEIEVYAVAHIFTGQHMAVIRDITERKRDQMALHDSRMDLNRAQAVAHTGSWRLDVRKNELLWSDETYRIFGIPKETPILYEAFFEAIHPDDRAYVAQKWDEALRGGAYDIEHRIIVRGRVKWVRERAELEFDPSGGLLGGFGTAQDITDKKLAELNETFLRQLDVRIRSFSDPNAIIDEMIRSVGEFLNVDRCLMGELDTESDELNYLYQWCRGGVARAPDALRILEIATPEFRNSFVAGETAAISDVRIDPRTGPYADKHTLHGTAAFAAARYVREGRLHAFLSVHSSVPRIWRNDEVSLLQETVAHIWPLIEHAHAAQGLRESENRMRMLIEELQRSRDELEMRVQERTLQLEQSNQSLQEFASIASHDMQEPLRKIMMFGNHLRTKCGASLGDLGSDYLVRMEKAASRMQTLLNSLLDYSRVTTRIEPFVSIDLNQIVAEVLEDLEARFFETGAQVRSENLPIIQGDPIQIRQLFQNLIGNAVKYHGDEKPLIRVSGRPFKKNKWQILIEDNGIGFEDKYLEKIFSPFQRLHGRSSVYEGTGMGLAICKKIVERHGGEITAKSKSGEGATFIVTFPI